MSGQMERGRGSILKVMSDDEVWNRLEAARGKLADLESFVPSEPAKLEGLRRELGLLQGMVERNESREAELAAELQKNGARSSGVLSMVIARSGSESDVKLLKDQVAGLREGRARLNQQISHVVGAIGVAERGWAAEVHAAKAENVGKISAARARVGELEEAGRLLVRPSPENRERAHYLARTDFERVLHDRVKRATSIRPAAFIETAPDALPAMRA